MNRYSFYLIDQEFDKFKKPIIKNNKDSISLFDQTIFESNQNSYLKMML